MLQHVVSGPERVGRLGILDLSQFRGLIFT